MNAFGKIILLSVILWWAAGCNRSYNVFNGTFRHESYSDTIDLLTAQPVDIDVLGFKVLWIEDALLFVAMYQDPEKLLSIYSLDDYRLIYDGLILKGNGPSEHINIEFVSSYTDSSGVKIWLTVDYLRKLLCIDATRSIIDKKIVIIKEYDLSSLEDFFALHYVFVQSDSSFVLMRGYNNYQISTYNPVSQQERLIGWMYKKDIERHNITDIGAGSIYESENSILISGMSFFNQINFYFLKQPENSFSISTVKEATHYNQVLKVEEVGKRPRYYGAACCRANELFVFSYLGGKNIVESNSPEDNYLHIIDINGKLHRIDKLNKSFAAQAFDIRTGYLYGIDAETWDIIKYKIR